MTLRTRIRMRDKEKLSSIVWMLVGLGFIWGGLKLGIGPLNAPGPGFFPTLIGGIFSLLSATLLITASLRKNQPQEKSSFWKKEKSWKKVLLSLLSLVFYLISLNFLGYIITTFLFILYLLKFVGKGGWRFSILTAILVSFISYAIFKIGLGVLLPKGLIRIG